MRCFRCGRSSGEAKLYETAYGPVCRDESSCTPLARARVERTGTRSPAPSPSERYAGAAKAADPQPRGGYGSPLHTGPALLEHKEPVFESAVEAERAEVLEILQARDGRGCYGTRKAGPDPREIERACEEIMAAASAHDPERLIRAVEHLRDVAQSYSGQRAYCRGGYGPQPIPSLESLTIR